MRSLFCRIGPRLRHPSVALRCQGLDGGSRSAVSWLSTRSDRAAPGARPGGPRSRHPPPPAATISGRGRQQQPARGREDSLTPTPRQLLQQQKQQRPQSRDLPEEAGDRWGPDEVEQPPWALPRSGETLSSTSNAFVKHCARLLSSPTYREEAGTFLLVGAQLLKEAAGEAAEGRLTVRVLMVQEGAPVPAEVDAERVVYVSQSVMRRVTGLESTSGVQAVAELWRPDPVDLSSPASGVRLQRLLALDGVRDPGNLGTLLRTALAFGWDGVWLLPGCCDPLNDKALRASRGAPLRLRVGGGTLEELLELTQAHAMALLAADMGEVDGDGVASRGQVSAGASTSGRVDDASSGGSAVCLVLGSEGPGLSDPVRRVCRPVALPMAAGRMESLNVAVAGGVLMFALSAGLPKLLQRLEVVTGTDVSGDRG